MQWAVGGRYQTDRRASCELSVDSSGRSHVPSVKEEDVIPKIDVQAETWISCASEVMQSATSISVVFDAITHDNVVVAYPPNKRDLFGRGFSMEKVASGQEAFNLMFTHSIDSLLPTGSLMLAH